MLSSSIVSLLSYHVGSSTQTLGVEGLSETLVRDVLVNPLILHGPAVYRGSVQLSLHAVSLLRHWVTLTFDLDFRSANR